jgi:hypothetical protein
LAETAPTDIDDLGIDRPNVIDIDTQASARAGKVIGQDTSLEATSRSKTGLHAGLSRAKPILRLPRLGPSMMGKKDDPWLAVSRPQHPDETALGVAAFGVLDLDDVGAPISQYGARRRHKRELSDFQHAHAIHRARHRFPAILWCRHAGRPVIDPHVARPMIRLRRSALGVPAQRECVDTVNTAGVFDHR